jgi:hypothetical protein
MIRWGQQSLEVFCFGTFLAGAAHIILVDVSSVIWMQVLVSVAGIALMIGLGDYRSWSQKLDKPTAKPAAVAPPKASLACRWLRQCLKSTSMGADDKERKRSHIIGSR